MITKILNFRVLLLLTALAITFTYSSCRKDSFGETLQTASATTTTVKSKQRNSNGSVDFQPTIIGAERPNPYTVENMTQAWNALYPAHAVQELPATHVYLKFTPQDWEEVELLEEHDLTLFHYPLQNEVIQQGDYYVEPGKTEEDVPSFWISMPVDYVPPTTNYEILDYLVLPPDNSFLTAKAFVQKGFQPIGTEGGGKLIDECEPGCELYPYCFVCVDLGCNWSGTNPISLPVGCQPGSPDWPRCLEEECGTGPSEPPTNACGCPMPGNRRKPAGCIRVADTQIGPDPVRRARVITANGWFSWRFTYTDDQGCWKTDHTVGRFNKLRMWVRFKNGRLSVYEGSLNRPVNFVVALTDNRGTISGPPYNNINILYGNSAALGGKAKANWVASHVLNGSAEFDENAAADGFALPPSNVRVLISSLSSRASAPMFRKLAPIRKLVPDFVQILLGIPGQIFLAGINRLLPDVFLGITAVPSDVVKSIIYHEFAHASHAMVVGAGYWERVIRHTIRNNGRGTPPFANNDASDAGPTGIAESWADHLENEYANRTYGSAASIGGGTASGLDPWAFRNEVSRLSRGWVPSGLWNDLIDVNPSGNDLNFGIPRGIETPSGYTNGLLFPTLSNTTFLGLRMTLRGPLAGTTGNTPASIDALMMTGYGLP